jgi:hypothetical protein
MARGRTELDIKRVAMAKMKVFSQAGIRIIPERSSPQSKLIHSNTIRTKRRRLEPAFHTHRRYQENSRQEDNRFQHLPNSSRNALLDLLTQRRVMKPWDGHWLLRPRKRSSYQHFPNLNHSNEAHRKYTLAQEISDTDLRISVQCNSDTDIPLYLGILHCTTLNETRLPPGQYFKLIERNQIYFLL